MGAYSPPPAFTDALRDEVMARIVRPVLAEMARRGTPFRGVLFAGLMLTATGPRLIEFNVRFGDPECQALMLRLRSDLLAGPARGLRRPSWRTCDLRWSDAHSLVVVMAARGYPGAYAQGHRRYAASTAPPPCRARRSSTPARRRRRDGAVVATGGRVLGVGGDGGDAAGGARRRLRGRRRHRLAGGLLPPRHRPPWPGARMI